MRVLRWLCALLLLTLHATPVSAGFTMTLTVNPPHFTGSDTSGMTVDLLNSGDETAYSATLEVVHPSGVAHHPVTFDEVVPGTHYRRNVSLSIPDMESGSYPLVFSLQFHDSNNYPIYMVFDSRMTVGSHSTSRVHGTLSSLELPSDETGTLTLNLKNADDVPRTVTTRLLLPDSLVSHNPDSGVTVPPKSEATVEYTVENFMALPGSDFLVLAAIGYDEDGVHHSSLAQGRVKVLNKSERQSILLPAAAALLVVGGYAYFKLRK